MVAVLATPDLAAAAAFHGGDRIGVALHATGTDTLPGLGAHLADQVRKGLPAAPSQAAWDFLSIALAVFAADRFVLRSTSENGWVRVISLEVAVGDPTPWKPQEARFSAALRFLTGDIWHLKFSPGGDIAPNFQPKLIDRDTVCLFSGGLDSLLGAMKLLEEGKRPLLISQASPKEGTPQRYLAQMIGLEGHRFEGKVVEKWREPYEGSTRARSIVFFAYGALAASALKLGEVIVPENALIAINPPLTSRRLGSLSTRTTHPHFLSELQTVLAGAGINLRLTNIFEGLSKGEMLAASKHPNKAMLASASYSCGKGKRKNGQCGRCVPCLIRRASFHAAGVTDGTKPYFGKIELSKGHDDVVAARLGVARKSQMAKAEFERWIASSGPLPNDPKRRESILRAVAQGIDEVGAFLAGVKWQ